MSTGEMLTAVRSDIPGEPAPFSTPSDGVPEATEEVTASSDTSSGEDTEDTPQHPPTGEDTPPQHPTSAEVPTSQDPPSVEDDTQDTSQHPPKQRYRRMNGMDSLNRYLTLSAGEKLQSRELLEDLLRCMVCFDRYNEPKVLQCQHTFCEECLKRWSLKGGNGVKGLSCPTCRIRTPLTCTADIAQLPSDFKVTKLGELLKQVMLREHREQRSCDICVAMGTTKKASHYCNECGESFCTGCCGKHSGNSLFGSHHMMDLNAPDMASKLFCVEHMHKPIKFLCAECSTFICTVCAINAHNKHHVQDLQTGLHGYTRHLKEQLGLISDTMLSLRAAHEDLEDAQILAKAVHDELTESVDSAISTKTTKLTCCKNDLLEHISSKGFRPSLQDISWAIRSVKESAMSTVTDKTDTIISGFHDQRKSVVTDIDSRYKQLSVELVERIEKIAFHVASIESLQSYVTVLLSLNNSMEILTVYEELSTRIESVLESTDVEKITNDLVTFVSFKVDTGENSIGELVEEEVTVSKFIQKCQQQPSTETSGGATASALTNGTHSTSNSSSNSSSNTSTSSSSTSTDAPSEAEEQAAASLIDLAIEESDYEPYSTDTSSTTASAILDDSHCLRNYTLPPTPESTFLTPPPVEPPPEAAIQNGSYSGDDLTYNGGSFSRQDPIRRTVSFPIASSTSDIPTTSKHYEQDARPRSSSHTASNGDISSSNGFVESNSMPTRSNGEPSKSKPQDNKKSSRSSRPMSVMEPLGNSGLPGYEDSQRMKRSSSETPESNETLGSIKSADLANPEAKLKLLWEKDGVFRTLPGGRKAFGSSSSKRKTNAVSTDKNITLGIPEVRHPTDVVFMPNNDIVVADTADRNLQVMSSDLKMWSRVKDRRQPFVNVRPLAWGQIEPACVVQAPDISTPSSPTATHSPSLLDTNCTVLMTDHKDKCVKVVDINGKGTCVSTWGKTGFFSASKFKQPSGLAITTDHHWVVSDVGKHTVTVHDCDGRCLLQFGQRGKGGYGFEQPRYVLVDQHGRILVSDSGNGGVKVFDKDGQFILKIGHKDNSKLTCPMGLCQDVCGNILIADKQRHTVMVFANDGRYIRELELGDHPVRNPTGIAVSATGFVAVTQTDTPAVKMYTVQV